MIASAELLPEGYEAGSLSVGDMDISVGGLAEVVELRQHQPEQEPETPANSSTNVVTSDEGFNLIDSKIKNHPLLSPTEVAVLTTAAQRGTKAQQYLNKIGPKRAERLSEAKREKLQAEITAGQNAKEKMIKSNLRLVVSIAKPFRGHDLTESEMVNAGTIGLATAVEKFDWRLGYMFSTYATFWIRQAIQRAIAYEASPIRMPVHVHERLYRLKTAGNRLRSELGREPTTKELSEDTGISLNDIQEAVAAKQRNLRMDSLYRPVGQDGNNKIVDFIADDNFLPSDEEVGMDSVRAAIRGSLTSLPELHRQVIELRFGFDGREPMSLTATGKKFGFSKEMASRIEGEAMNHLRAMQEIQAAAESLEVDTSEKESKPEGPAVQWSLDKGEPVTFTADQATFLPFYFTKMKTREVANRLGISFASAKHRITTVRGKLRDVSDEEVTRHLQAMGIAIS